MSNEKNDADRFMAELQALLGVGQPRAPEGALCFCGSCQDAMEAAGRILKQTQDNQECILWFIQVAAAMRVLSIAALARGEGVPLEALMSKNRGEIHPSHVRAVDAANVTFSKFEQQLTLKLASTPDGYIPRIVELADQYVHI